MSIPERIKAILKELTEATGASAIFVVDLSERVCKLLTLKQKVNR